MAAAIWLVRTGAGQKNLVQGITRAVINSDDANTEADVIADATAVAQGLGLPINGTYFDSADLILAAGQMDADQDAILFGGDGAIEVIA
jgi:hypothetical protein